MDKYKDTPKSMIVCSPGNDDSYRRMMALMARSRDPVFIPVFVSDPRPLPDITMFDHSPLVHTPIAITRSAQIGTRRQSVSPSLMLMATVALTTSMGNHTSYRITGTAGLRDRLKSLEKNLQRNPLRNDIKLQIMELRNQIREIEAQNAKARKAQSKAKKRK